MSSDHQTTIPSVIVQGDFVESVIAIPQTLMSLMLAIGRLEDGSSENTLLVPLVELKLEGPNPTNEESAPPLLSVIVTFENAAFIISELANDFKHLCDHMNNLANATMNFEPTRILQSRHFLIEAQKHIQAAIDKIDQMKDSAG